MKLVAQIVSSLVLAAGSESLDDGSPSLLQLKAHHGASPEQHSLYNLSETQISGHPFGCTGRETAVNVISCGLWGDVHQHQKFQGGGHPDSFGTGWYWVAKSRDDEFQAQAFYRQYNGGWTSMSHFALKFGDNTLFMDRQNNGNSWMWKYYWNGQERSYAVTPVDIGGVHWVNRAQGSLANQGAQNAQWSSMVHGEAQRHSCFEFQNVAVWTSYQNWQNVNMGPFGQPGILEVEGSVDYLDPDFGQCAANQRRVDPSEMLVTIAQNNKVCSDDSLDAHQCEDPDPPPPPSTAQQLCESNGLTWQHAQDLCAGQDSHGDDIYEGCLFDVCASADADAEQNAVGGAEMEAAMANPRATCLVSPEPCTPCNICSDSTRADLSNIVQNNLGGVGPDPSGPEEIRYKNAMDLGSGRLVDVVLVTEGSYQTVPNRRGIIPNGNNGQGFGRFTMETGTSSDFTFLFQDATTGAPVSIPDISLTFYDLDEARNRLQRETITACGVQEVYITEDTELTYARQGTCHSLTSSVVGTGADNPKTASELTKTQAARSVTYEFHSRASISWSASVTGNRWSPRPILFSFEPQVACGASDSETQCASGPVLQNRDFEIGFTTNNYEYTHNVWGWTANGGIVAVRSDNAPWGGIVAQSGSYLLALQSNGASVAQTVTGCVPGRSYSLRVSAAQRTNSPGGPNAVLRVTANGQDLMNSLVQATAMEVQSLTFTADSSTVELKFENVVASGDQTVFIDAIELGETPDWTMAVALSGSGTTVETDIGQTQFNRLFSECPFVKYKRNGAVHAVYKRRVDRNPLNAYSLFTYLWSSTNNELRNDFDLYDSEADARSETGSWAYCNYDDPDVGFPRDCGVSGGIGNTWFTMPSAGQNDASSGGGPQRFDIRNINSGASFEIYTGSDCPTSTGQPQWTMAVALSGTGTTVETDIGQAEFNRLFRECPFVQYSRNGAVHAVYKRRPGRNGLNNNGELNNNAYSLFTYFWSSSSNELRNDFDLYDSEADARSETGSWAYCNYDDPDVGFPRDCGKSGGIGNTWFTMPSAGQNDASSGGGPQRFDIRSINSGASFEIYTGSDCPTST